MASRMGVWVSQASRGIVERREERDWRWDLGAEEEEEAEEDDDDGGALEEGYDDDDDDG